MAIEAAVATLAANVANLAIEVARLGRGQESMLTTMNIDRVADAREHGEVNERLARVEVQLHATIAGHRQLEKTFATIQTRLNECTEALARNTSRRYWLRRAVNVVIGLGSAVLTYLETHKR